MCLTCRLAGIAALFALAVGCNGGADTVPQEDTVTVPAAPVLSLAIGAIKTFDFTWPDVASESEYRLLEDPDSVSGYAPIAVIPAGAGSRALEVFLPARINARYLLQACNAAGCADSDPVHVSGTLDQAIGYFKASNTGAGDVFGHSVALSADGSTLAVGAFREASAATGIDGDQNDNSAPNAGAVYLY